MDFGLAFHGAAAVETENPVSAGVAGNITPELLVFVLLAAKPLLGSVGSACSCRKCLSHDSLVVGAQTRRQMWPSKSEHAALQKRVEKLENIVIQQRDQLDELTARLNSLTNPTGSTSSVGRPARGPQQDTAKASAAVAAQPVLPTQSRSLAYVVPAGLQSRSSALKSLLRSLRHDLVSAANWDVGHIAVSRPRAVTAGFLCAAGLRRD